MFIRYLNDYRVLYCVAAAVACVLVGVLSYQYPEQAVANAYYTPDGMPAAADALRPSLGMNN